MADIRSLLEEWKLPGKSNSDQESRSLQIVEEAESIIESG